MNNTILPEFRYRLHELRLALGLTQVEFAEITNISRGYIATMERGIRNPSLRVLYILHQKFGMSIDAMLEELDPTSLPPE